MKKNIKSLKIKLLFIKMCWKVLTNTEHGWIFFRLTEKQQQAFLNGNNVDEITFRYLGVNKSVIEILVKRFENNIEK